ncbi:hypothetical protein LCGC14_0660190 [marine sediment metagenome]|uniref:Uncharacterized protein n=1 Tax=marine sediment metagenome TaxID=412755 RepID=A0A0F9TF60_9ZZZZ
MKLSDRYKEIVGVCHPQGDEETHDILHKVASLEESLEDTWAVLLKRKPSIGGHIASSTENVIAELESENERLRKWNRALKKNMPKTTMRRLEIQIDGKMKT